MPRHKGIDQLTTNLNLKLEQQNIKEKSDLKQHHSLNHSDPHIFMNKKLQVSNFALNSLKCHVYFPE